MNNRISGFTLLELLLATVLSSVLMIGVLAVVVRLGSPSSGQQRDHVAVGELNQPAPAVDDASIEQVYALLRDDLSHADGIDVSRENELALTGPAALDRGNFERTHRPVGVVYLLEEVDGRMWLVRRQAELDVLTNENEHRDLVCTGIRRLMLVESRGHGQGATTWRLRVWTDDSGDAKHERIVAIRQRKGA